MITVQSANPLAAMEAALSRAAQKHGLRIISITPFRSLFADGGDSPLVDAISFTVVHSEIYATLVAADARFSALLPCRIAVVEQENGISLHTVSPTRFTRLLDRSGLEPLAVPLEALLRKVMEEAANVPVVHGSHRSIAHSLLGAREGQGSMRASIPQRIDAHGTKVEDLGGTGKVDAPGG